MSTKDKVNEDQKSREGGFDNPFGSFQEMSEMMKSCCRKEAFPFDCCSVMAAMMRSSRRPEANQEHGTETSPKGGQNG